MKSLARVLIVIRQSVTVAYAIAIAWLSLAPSRQFSRFPHFPQADKVVHAGLYGVLALLLLWCLKPHARRRRIALVTVVVVCAGYGALLEALQGLLMPGDRAFSVMDMLANLAGAAGTTGLVRLWMVRREAETTQR